MRAAQRAVLLAGLIAAATALSGCSSLWHDIQPYRLHRLNRGEGLPGGVEAYSAYPSPDRHAV